MKLKKGIPIIAALLVSVLLAYTFINSLAFANTAELRGTTTVFPMLANFEDGYPANWFVYGDWGNISVDIAINTVADSDPTALPGQIGPNSVLSVTANVPTWAGFGAGFTPAQDWSDYDALSFWFYGENSGTTHEFEIQTASSDNRRASFVDNFTGWRHITLPFVIFGATPYDLSQVTNWVFILDGMNGLLLLDNLQLVNLQPFADFEGGFPASWFIYGDWGNIEIDITNPTIPDNDPLALPGQVGPNDILSVTANVPSWAGFGAGFTPAQDWSDMQGVSFWFYGENSGTTYGFEIQTAASDNRRASFVDDFAGWRHITLPFVTFGDTPYDLTQVTNWVFILDGMGGAFNLDDVGVYSDAGNVTVSVQFAQPTYTVIEGETVTLTVALNFAITGTVSVDYETADGTADSSDYVPTSGTLTFPTGVLTQTITVETIKNNLQNGSRNFTVHLTNPTNADLGEWAIATVTILDDEAPEITVNLLELSVELVAGTTTVQSLEICNIGTLTLDWTIIKGFTTTIPPVLFIQDISPGGKTYTSTMTDIPWLVVAPTGGDLLPGVCQTVEVTFDARGIETGDYSAGLHIHSNDSETPQVVVTVTMTVVIPEPEDRSLFLPVVFKH
jgi:hypothetical protein